MLPKKGFYIPRAREMDMVPSIWNNFSETTLETKKWHGVRMKSYKVFFVNRNHIAVYKKSEWKAAEQHVLQRFLKDPTYFRHIWQKNAKIGKQTEKLIFNILKKTKTASIEQLLKNLLALKKQWITFDQINILPWFLGAEPLRKYLKHRLASKFKVNNEDMETLFTANTFSLATEEALAVLKTAVEFLKTKNIFTLSGRLSKEFGWIPFGYDGPTYWDRAHYERRIKEATKMKPEILKKKVALMSDKMQKLHSVQNELIENYKIDTDTKRLLDIQQKLYVMTDIRKKVHFNTNYVYHQTLERLQKPSGLTLHELKYLDAEEVLQMFRIKAFKKYYFISTKRQTSFVCAYTVKGKKEIIIVGKQAKKMLAKYAYEPNQVNKVTGMIANKIGTGITKGMARKITNPREMAKMKKGEILITWMTTPDFVPAMRKAKAIVTDEGGITSHAAIVSRELGIPCIIGTKIATKIFKDGDMVEVDANKGIVRKT